MNNIVDIKNLQRKLDKVTVINGISAQVQAGDVIALLGKNGAGKTTLLETILGFAFPSSGGVSLWGTQSTNIEGDIKQRIGFVPQQDELLTSLSGREHVDLFAGFRTTWNRALAERLITEWSIPVDKKVGKMSVGQRQKLSIVLALSHEPELLILDEPVASLDPIARRQFLQQLIEIASDENRAVIFSTHIVSDVERVANQVWMLRDGVLAYQDELDQLKETTARITIISKGTLPENLALTNTINQSVKGNQAQVTLTQWYPEMQSHIEQQFNAQVQVEHLSLEDIFLEMNK
jgi:ABC-2 type transport system ATP-binding protein